MKIENFTICEFFWPGVQINLSLHFHSLQCEEKFKIFLYVKFFKSIKFYYVVKNLQMLIAEDNKDFNIFESFYNAASSGVNYNN